MSTEDNDDELRDLAVDAEYVAKQARRTKQRRTAEERLLNDMARFLADYAAKNKKAD